MRFHDLDLRCSPSIQFDCQALHLLPTVDRRIFSDDNQTMNLPMNKAEYLNCLFVYCSVSFGFTLGLWAIQSLVSGHPSSIMSGMGCFTWSGHQVKSDIGWTPTSSAQKLSLQILKSEQMVDTGVFVCIGGQVSFCTACRTPFCAKEYKTWGWSFQPCTIHHLDLSSFNKLSRYYPHQ